MDRRDAGARREAAVEGATAVAADGAPPEGLEEREGVEVAGLAEGNFHRWLVILQLIL